MHHFTQSGIYVVYNNSRDSLPYYILAGCNYLAASRHLHKCKNNGQTIVHNSTFRMTWLTCHWEFVETKHPCTTKIVYPQDHKGFLWTPFSESCSSRLFSWLPTKPLDGNDQNQRPSHNLRLNQKIQCKDHVQVH